MAGFPETQWSQILALQDAPGAPDNASRRRDLLQALALQYRTPVYHYVRAIHRGAAEDAEDVTQQFFVLLLDRGDLQRLSPLRGSFRGFLKTAIRNFVISRKRAEKARSSTLAFDAAERVWQAAPIDDPDRAFDREWVRVVLGEAIERLGIELHESGNDRQMAVFRDYCLGDDREISYQALAQRYETNLDEIRNGLRAARQRLRRIMRTRLRDYVAPGEDLEAELRFIVGEM